ncbi:unnamed protein product [Effrenium voratum]|nr:unnamed protein product [Effrenium voratum]
MDFESFVSNVRSVWDKLQALGATCGAAAPRQEDVALSHIFVLHPLDADHPEALRATKRGARLLHEGRTEESIRELHDARQLSQSHVACSNLGCAYHAKNDDRAALYWYREAYRLQPQDETATCALALLEQRRGEAEEARRLLVSFLQVDASHVGALRLLGRLHQRQCQWSQAAGCFHRLIEVDPTNDEWPAQLQVCLDQLEAKDGLQGHAFSFDATEALSHAAACRRRGDALSATSTTCSSMTGPGHSRNSPGRGGGGGLGGFLPIQESFHSSAGQGLAEAQRARRMGNTDDAVDIYRGLLSREPRNTEALMGYADCQQDLGNLDEALSAMKQMLSTKSDDVEANLRVAELLLEQGKDSAVDNFLRFASLGRSRVGPALQQRLLCAEAHLALNKEDHVKALATASEAVRVDACSGKALLLLAMARHRVADYSAALRAASAALEAAEEKRQTKLQADAKVVASQAHERLREYPEAIACAERALASGAGAEARVARAVALQQSGRAREAEEELMSVLQSHPQHALARLQLAYCQLLGGNANRAGAILEGLLASRASLPRSLLGCAKVYLALALAEQQRTQRASSLAQEALTAHRNLQTAWDPGSCGGDRQVWREIESGQQSGTGALQRLRGICDLDLTAAQARQLLQLLAAAANRPELAPKREGGYGSAASVPSTPAPSTPNARGRGGATPANATPCARSRDQSQDRAFTIGWNELIRPEQLMLGPQLGAGGSAQVFKGSWNGQEVAVKRISGLAHLEAMKKEVDALRRLRHPRLVRFIGACVQPPLLLVVTEYMAGGSLHDRLFGCRKALSLSSSQRWLIACQTAEGLAFLHAQRVVHRDLKSMNILLDSAQNAKICDFGLAHQMCMESTHIARKLDGEGGSPRYMAPECYDAKIGKLTEKVDIWAAGCILIELFGGVLPYADCLTMPQLTARILVEKRPPDVPPGTPPQIVALIGRCVMFDPSWRITATELQSELARLRR